MALFRRLRALGLKIAVVSASHNCQEILQAALISCSTSALTDVMPDLEAAGADIVVADLSQIDLVTGAS